MRDLIPTNAGPGFPTRGGGTRWYVPNTDGLDVIRLSPGDPRLDSANVHSGPHVYVSRTATCYPLEGNTAPWPAPPMSEEQFFDHVVLETLDDAIGLWELTAMAAATFPDSDSSGHKRRARLFVATLLERRWVDLCEKRPADTEAAGWNLVPRNEQAALVTTLSDGAWDPEGIAKASARYFALGSDLGENEFHMDLLRRGLYSAKGRGRSRWPFS